jgi:succinyl-CoA synthetase beta subunit
VLLKEFEGRNLFQKYGIRVPRGFLIEKNETGKAGNSLNGFLRKFPDVKRLVLKAQIFSGKRGKSGVVIFSDGNKFSKDLKTLFGKTVGAEKVNAILAAERLKISKEYYLSVALDRFARGPVLIISSEGGIDIEETAKKMPDKILKIGLSRLNGSAKKNFIKILGGKGMAIAEKLIKLFEEEDCELAEINPLILDAKGRLYAADSKIIIDDNALYRHPQYKKLGSRNFSKLEIDAKKNGLAYVELEGSLAIIGNGAGLVMATLDAVKAAGAEPANFCDIGGGASTKMMEKAMEIVLRKKSVKAVFVNIFGGITHCDDVARGLSIYIRRKRPGIPIVVRLTGTNENIGREILNKEGIKSFVSFKEAVAHAASIK